MKYSSMLHVLIISCSRMKISSVDEGQEESGTQLTLDETYDTVRKGVRASS